jgi:hypothetical protein
MSKTHLGLFAIIAIASLMIVSVQYSEAVKPSEEVIDIEDRRTWTDFETGSSSICNEQSVSTIKNGYSHFVLYTNGHATYDEKSTKDHYNADEELIGTTIIMIQGDLTPEEDGTFKVHSMTKTKCYNGEKNSNDPTVKIIHKNGKTTDN